MVRMSRTASLALLAALGLLSPLALAVPAVAKEKTDQGGQRRQSVDLTIQGRGFGHGRGLSQYGAKGRAEAGDTWQDIVGFYYPGTTIGTAKGRIRVLISADTSNDVVVVPRDGLTVRSLGREKTWTLRGSIKGDKVTRWRIEPDGRRSEISYRTGSGRSARWQVWKRPRGEAEFAAGKRPVALVTPSGTAKYRGALRSVVPDSGRGRDTVNVVRLDDYVRGVVPSEVPALWSGAAVAAQAVAARTYAAFERADNRGDAYDLCDTSHCQVYRGVGGEHPAADAQVRATKRQIMTYDDAPAFTQFSASNGGYSVAGDQPYLVAQPDPADNSEVYPGWSWNLTVDATRLESLAPAVGTYQSIKVTSRVDSRTYRDGGRVLAMKLTGTKGSATVTGEQFRSFYGLKSTLFRLP